MSANAINHVFHSFENLYYPIFHTENTPETGSDYNLAVKMMFNYGLDSNATAIFEGMKKETVPARITDESLERVYLQHG